MADDLVDLIPEGMTLSIRKMKDRLIYTLLHDPDDRHVATVRKTVPYLGRLSIDGWRETERGIVRELVSRVRISYRTRGGVPVDRLPDGRFVPRICMDGWERFVPHEASLFLLPCPICRSRICDTYRYPDLLSPTEGGLVYEIRCSTCGGTSRSLAEPVISEGVDPGTHTMIVRALSDYGRWIPA
jgi:hypothetical protein